MTSSRIPVTDISKKGEGYLLFCELPGIERDDLDVAVDGRRLTIAARRRWTENGRVLLSEIPDGDFRRSFLLDETLSTADIEAEFRNGLLVLSIPGRGDKGRQTIPIDGTDSESGGTKSG
jgi:HSP20 family protein